MQFAVIDVDLASDNCPRDVLLIYDGAVAAGEAVKRLCGHWENWEWITRDHDAVLRLISDDSDTYQGFYLNFQSIEKNSVTGMFSTGNFILLQLGITNFVVLTLWTYIGPEIASRELSWMLDALSNDITNNWRMTDRLNQNLHFL